MFQLHDLKTKPKYNKVQKKIYGERAKFLLWLNSEVVLACYVKMVLDMPVKQKIVIS